MQTGEGEIPSEGKDTLISRAPKSKHTNTINATTTMTDRSKKKSSQRADKKRQRNG
jgi:hypothetical protein